jgi:hypothetical protein
MTPTIMTPHQTSERLSDVKNNEASVTSPLGGVFGREAFIVKHSLGDLCLFSLLRLNGRYTVDVFQCQYGVESGICVAPSDSSILWLPSYA